MGTSNDHDTEQQEQLLAYRITDEVKTRLIRWIKGIGAILTILLAVVGVFGYRDFRDLKSDAREQALRFVRDSLRPELRSSIDSLQMQAKLEAQSASVLVQGYVRQADEYKGRLDMLRILREDDIARIQSNLELVKDSIDLELRQIQLSVGDIRSELLSKRDSVRTLLSGFSSEWDNLASSYRRSSEEMNRSLIRLSEAEGAAQELVERATVASRTWDQIKSDKDVKKAIENRARFLKDSIGNVAGK